MERGPHNLIQQLTKKGGLLKKLANEFVWIYKTLKKYLFRVISHSLIEVIHTLLELVISYKVGSVVDSAIGKDARNMLHLGILFLILFSANAVISIIAIRFASYNFCDMQKTLRVFTFKKVLNADWEELVNHSNGDLITRLEKDTQTVAGNASGLIPTIVVKILTIVLSLCLIIHYDPTMILVVLLITPVILLSSRVFMGKIFVCQQQLRNIESRVTSFDKETFHNMQTLKAFNICEYFQEKMQSLEEERRKINLRSNLFGVLSWVVTYLSAIFAGIICGVWAFYRVSEGIMTLGNLSVIVVLIVRIASCGKALLGLIPIMLETVSASERLREICHLPKEACNIENEESASDRPKEIESTIFIHDASFMYKSGKVVFDKVSLEAKPGEIVALVGPSGEGKTTLLRILLGIIRIQSGQAYTEKGKEIIDFGPSTRNLISYVPQGNTMMSGTIADNVRLIRQNATDEDVINALKTACAYEFVQKLPGTIHYMIGESGLGFSEGQNQRLAIARAIINDTPILLMDEATSALDVVTERKVLSNIMKENKKRTCIITTHRPSVLTMCDRVYRISNTHIEEINEEQITELINDF